MRASKPVRALQVLYGLGMGGAETWLMEVLRLWSRTGAGRMDFLATGGTRSVFDEEAEQLGAKIHYLRYTRRSLPGFVRSFRRLLREGGYDAIHDHADYASGWHYAIAAGTLPPVRVTHIHNPRRLFEANYATTRTRKLLMAGGKTLVQRLATHVCGTSEDALTRYGFSPQTASPPKIEVLHCGFDPVRFAGPRNRPRNQVLQAFSWPDDARLILHAGRLDEALTLRHPRNHKNTWLIVNIVREAIRLDPRIRLILAGDGAARDAYRQKVREWGLQSAIKLVGNRRDIATLMRAADVFLFPSAEEGLGMAAVEAQAAGLPVLASTAVPGEAVVIPELYEARSLEFSVSEWAAALLELLDRPRPDLAHCQAMFQSSPYSIHDSARRLEALYRSRQ